MSDATYPEKKLTFRQIANSRTFIGSLAAVVVVGIAVAAVLLTGGSPSNEERLQEQIMPVQIEQAQSIPSVDYKRILVGEIKAKRSSDLAFERTAKIKKILVDDGMSVKKDQPLAELDTEDLKISKRRAEAALKNARALQTELKQGARAEVKAAALAEVNALEAEMKLANVIKKKRDQLYKSNSISEEEFQQAELTYDAAAQRLASAKSKYVELINGTRQEKIDAQDAMVEQLEAQLDAIVLDIKKSTMVAPFSGAISMRYLDEGTIVASGSPVLRISENHRLEAVVGVPPTALKQIKIGDKLNIFSKERIRQNLPPKKATVIRILPESDTRTRLIPVVIELDSKTFKPGELVRIELSEIQELKNGGIRVKTVSLVPRAKGLSAVYVVTKVDGEYRAKLVPVSPLFNDGEYTIIEGPISEGDQVAVGVKDGDQIISGGVHRITNGQIVSLLSKESKE